MAIYNSIRHIITSDLVSELSSYYKEDRSSVKVAITSTISGLLYSLLIRHNATGIESILKKSGKEYPEMEKHFHELFLGKSEERIYYLGARFLDELFNDRINTFISLISSHSGLSMKNSDQLISVLASFLAGYLGNILLKDKSGFREMMQQLTSEKTNIRSDIPPRLSEMFDMSGSNTTRYILDNEGSGNNNFSTKERSYSWLRFFLFLLILAIVVVSVMLWWKTCH
ncbi:MAG: DUF937 domain-containing protein [Dysgonomonas sp.]|nr:DUF937 domain-containing protein [Dysgonomonas sp.]